VGSTAVALLGLKTAGLLNNHSRLMYGISYLLVGEPTVKRRLIRQTYQTKAVRQGDHQFQGTLLSPAESLQLQKGDPHFQQKRLLLLQAEAPPLFRQMKTVRRNDQHQSILRAAAASFR